MAQSTDPRYRLLHKSIVGGVFTCAIGFFLVADGMALLAGVDPLFAQFRNFGSWIGWFFVAIGAFNIAKSVAGLFKLDRDNRSSRKAAGKQAEALETPAEIPGDAPVIRGFGLFFVGVLLLFGAHNLFGLFGFSRDVLAKYAALIHAAGWLLVALALLVNRRLIFGWIKAVMALLRDTSPPGTIDQPRVKDVPPPTPPAPAVPGAPKEKPKHERRPIIERRR